MSARQLSIWNTLTNAFCAPFRLDAASWKALGRPGLAFIIASALPLVAKHLQWGDVVQLLLLIPVYMTLAWFALDYQRYVLTGVAASESWTWRRYGLYLLLTGLLMVFVAVFLSMLTYMVLPAVAWFLLAINSPQPWIATGAVLLWVLVVIIIAYPVVRFTLIFPAVSVGHRIAPARIWRLSRKNGLRLLFMIVIIPGLVNGMLYIIFEFANASLWSMVFVSLLNIYLALVYLTIIALSYRALSDQQLPAAGDISTKRRSHIRNTRVLLPVAALALLGLVGIAIWDGVYRVHPGETVLISRYGKTERIESAPGIRVKIPLLEDTQRIREDKIHSAMGMGRFFTMRKDALLLNYDLRWRITDADVFTKATAGKYWVVQSRIKQLLKDSLRNRIIELSQDEVVQLRNAGLVEVYLDKQSDGHALFADMLQSINSTIRKFGVQAAMYRITVDSHSDAE